MHGLHPADLVVLVVYLAGITALGVWMARRVRNLGDFFMPRRFGKTMMVTFAFGTGTASDQAVSVAAETLRSGLSGIWWQWVWLPATPFYWLIAPIMRRFRAITTADVYALRYDRSVAVLFAVVGIVGLSVKIGLLLKGSSALIDSATGGAVPAEWAVAVVTVLFVAYGTAGGLGAAIVTDFIQGILTVVFSFMLLPLVLDAVGGMEGVRQTIRDPQMLSLVVPGEIGVFFVVMYAVQALMGIVAQPFIMGVCAAGRTEMDGRVGFMVGNVVKRICTIAWSLTALAAVAWYLRRGVALDGVEADHVYGDVARAFLPAVMPGLLGVFLASLVAAVMSSCDAMMVSSSALLTKNVYKPLVPGRPDRHYVLVGRLASVVVVAGGIAFAYWVPDVVTALKIWFRIAPMMGIAFWLGLFWRRATAVGAWAVTLTGFGCWFLTTRHFFIEAVARLPFAEQLNLVWQNPGQPAEIYQPWSILFYIAAALAAGVIASLLSRPVPEDRLDRFYTLTRTPIVPGEEVTEPCTLPEGVEPARRPMLFTAFGLEVPMPSRTSMIGFLAGWLAVAALVGGFLLIVAG
jgi:Na+/proline symporter